MSDVPLLPSLEPEVARLLARHNEASARIDWSYREFLPLEALHAPSDTPPLSDLAYTAVETALLTEANLPWYTAVLHEGLRDSLAPLQEFVRVWTSEEDQHSTLLETYLLLTDNGDHAERGRRRKAVLASGWSHQLEGAFEAMVYTTIQELATQVFYICTARVCEPDDPTLARALRRIAKDETRHYAFYRDVVKAHLDADPAYVIPLVNVLVEFQMPGRVMSDFDERSRMLASEGVFGPEQYHNEVVEVACSFWNVDDLASALPEARVALTRLNRYRAMLRRLAKHRSASPAVGGRSGVG
ncbi:MAG: acyl-ACP desaturase [Chloroflexi bacterium]|nr:acyl-ACP desaturase [Chloroflexota bacterium]